MLGEFPHMEHCFRLNKSHKAIGFWGDVGQFKFRERGRSEPGEEESRHRGRGTKERRFTSSANMAEVGEFSFNYFF